MSRSFLQFERSEWWILLILILSALLSYSLYQKKQVPWNLTQNRLLFGLRFLAIFCLLLLVLEPSVKRVISRIEQPVISFAIDDSQSILARGADPMHIYSSIHRLKSELEAEEFTVEQAVMSGADSVRFDSKTTNLSSLLSATTEDNRDKNQAATLLFTDGIYNRGASPLYQHYTFPIFTAGLGDTIPPKDISISRVRYNRVSYKGNETPIRVEISQEGYTNKNIELTISEQGKALKTENVLLQSNVREVALTIPSDREGLRHLTVTVTDQGDESSAQNNKADVFLEVIDGAEKVLIVAAQPHPDIKAIRTSLEATDNYETTIYIPAISKDLPSDIYDVIIYHGAFSFNFNTLPKGNAGVWYILNSGSNLNELSESVPYLKINRKGGQPDKVTGSFNQNFSKFKVENTEVFEDYPPIRVPYADYTVTGAAEILIHQRLGKITTKKPLMAVYDDGLRKSAVLLGQDIWKWKLQEAAINGNANGFDELITKTVQFLSVKNDKEQFRFIPRSSTFQDASPVLFDVEVYNDIYERIYGKEITIGITNEKNEDQVYSFIDSELNGSFRAPNLAPGIYQYRASVQTGSKQFDQKGEFLIKSTNTEYFNLTANHRLLRNLSSKTKGEYVHFSEIEKMVNLIKERDFKSIIKSEESLQKLAAIRWWYVLIFILFSTEWFLRRYWGGY